LREGPFESLWVQPAAGDAGGALGAALFVWHQLLENPREPTRERDSQKGSFLGPGFAANDVKAFLDSEGAVYREFEEEDELLQAVCELIASERVVGHMEGRMEFGPRALGNRSILGDARSLAMQSKMNLKIKFRESFRPFAPAVLRENAHDYFDVRVEDESPYMLLVAPVAEKKRLQVPSEGDGLDKLKQARSEVPAVTHVDYTARVQTVDAERHPRFHRLLEIFEKKTGCPVMINTSFNVRGEPIVCSPADAYRCFMATNMDALVIDRFLLMKDDQPNACEHDVDAYLARFQLD
jgi:carbamoyltransferase